MDYDWPEQVGTGDAPQFRAETTGSCALSSRPPVPSTIPDVCAGCSRGLGEHEPHFWRNHEARCSRCWDRLLADQNEATIRRLERSIAERSR